MPGETAGPNGPTFFRELLSTPGYHWLKNLFFFKNSDFFLSKIEFFFLALNILSKFDLKQFHFGQYLLNRILCIKRILIHILIRSLGSWKS